MNIKLPLSFCMLALASLAFVVSGRAEEGKADKAPSKEMLKKYDSNNDGMISAEEKEAGKAAAKAEREVRRQAELEKYDENKDDKINKDERAKIMADKEAEMQAHKAEMAAKKAEREANKAEMEAKKAERKAMKGEKDSK